METQHQSLQQALTAKYGSNENTDAAHGVIFCLPVAPLHKLRIAVVASCDPPVGTLIPKVGDSLYTATSLQSLDVSRNRVSSWEDVSSLLVSAPRLRTLNLSDNLGLGRDVGFKVHEPLKVAASVLRELNVDGIPFHFSDLISIVSQLAPTLSVLSARNCRIGILSERSRIGPLSLQHLPTYAAEGSLQHQSAQNSSCGPSLPDQTSLPNLQQLRLDRNDLSSWTVLRSICGMCPKLMDVSLQDNLRLAPPGLPTMSEEGAADLRRSSSSTAASDPSARPETGTGTATSPFDSKASGSCGRMIEPASSSAPRTPAASAASGASAASAATGVGDNPPRLTVSDSGCGRLASQTSLRSKVAGEGALVDPSPISVKTRTRTRTCTGPGTGTGTGTGTGIGGGCVYPSATPTATAKARPEHIDVKTSDLRSGLRVISSPNPPDPCGGLGGVRRLNLSGTAVQCWEQVRGLEGEMPRLRDLQMRRVPLLADVAPDIGRMLVVAALPKVFEGGSGLQTVGSETCGRLNGGAVSRSERRDAVVFSEKYWSGEWAQLKASIDAERRVLLGDRLGTESGASARGREREVLAEPAGDGTGTGTGMGTWGASSVALTSDGGDVIGRGLMPVKSVFGTQHARDLGRLG